MFRFRLSPVPILWTSAQEIFENLQLIEEIRLKIFNGMKILYRIIGRVHTELSAGVYTACLMYCQPFRVPPRTAKVLKGRPEPKQATPVPACNGMKTRFPDENDKTRRPSEMKAAFSEFD